MRTARWMVDGERDLAEDLVQEALVALWEMDHARYGGEDELPRLRRNIWRRMRRVARRELRKAGGGPIPPGGKLERELRTDRTGDNGGRTCQS